MVPAWLATRNLLPAVLHMQGLVVRERGDTNTLDDHKLLWAREGPVHKDIEVPTYSLHTGVASILPTCSASRERHQSPRRTWHESDT